MPMVMPPLDEAAIEPLLDRLDGICLSGGPDLDPDTYGAAPHPELGPIEPDLDRFELALARAAPTPASSDPGDLPWHPGAQRGPRRHPAPAPARRLGRRSRTARRRPATSPATRSTSSPASRLRPSLGGRPRLDVNAFHHQAIERLGQGARGQRAGARRRRSRRSRTRTAPSCRRPVARRDARPRPEAALFARFVEACRGDRAAGDRAAREVA